MILDICNLFHEYEKITYIVKILENILKLYYIYKNTSEGEGMKKIISLFMVALLSMSIVGCDSGSSDNKDSVTNIKIGAFGPYEGDASVYGVAVRNGIQLAIDDFNANNTLLGGKVELVSYDTKADPIEATNAYNKLVDSDEVVAIVGGVTSGESVAVAQHSQSVGTVMISPSATALEFASTGPNVFRACYTDPIQAEALAKYAISLGHKNIAIIYNSGLDYSIGLKEVFEKTLNDNGITLVASEAYSEGDTDFNAQLTKIKSANPELIFIPDYYQNATLIAKQVKALGIEATLMGGDGVDGILDINKDDTTAIEGFIFSNHYSPEDDVIIGWDKKYQEAYNQAPNAFAFLAYDATNLLIQAIEKAGTTDQAKIQEQMQATNFDGILGHLEFDENGDPKKDVAFVTIKDGKYATHK